MKPYRYLLLDFDNTLVNFTETERIALCLTFKHLFSRSLTDEEVHCYNAINRSYWEKLERREVTKDQLKDGRMRDFSEKLGIKDVDTTVVNLDYMNNLAHTIVEYPGSFEACKKLAEHYILYIITNGTDYIQHSRLEGTSFFQYISDIFISDEIGVNKPAPEFFDAIVRKTGDRDLSHYLVVGDSLTSDILFGKNIGVDTCYVGNKDCDADYRILDISELPGILM